MLEERKTKEQLIAELSELRQRLIIFEHEQKKLELSLTERKRAGNIMHARLRLLKFAESHALEGFTQATLDESEALTGSTIGFYHLVEPDQQTLLLQSWSTNTLRHMCTAKGKGRHYDVAEGGVWVDCVRQRRPIIHNSYETLPHRKELPPGHAPVVRELVVPIFRADKIVAIIGVGNKPTDYDEWDVEAVSLLGDLSWDITERKRAEEALRENEEYYRSLFNNMLNGFAYCQMHFEHDRPVDFTYLEVNAAFEDLTGLKNVVGKKVSEVIPGIRESDPEILEIYGRVALTGKSERFETYIQSLDMWFSISVYCPRRGCFVAVFDVITERRQTEAALRESEARFRGLYENMTEGVAIHEIIYDEQHTAVDYRILATNPAFAVQTGLQPEQINGQLASAAYGTGQAPFLETFAQVAATGQPLAFETFFQQMNRYFYISASSPQPGQFVTVFEDITARKKMDEDLRRAKDELEQRVQQRTAELSIANEKLLQEAEERRLAEKQAESVGRLYRLLSKVNEAIVRARETEWLFRQACRIMMEEGDFRLCWIGRVDREAGVVRQAAQYDLMEDYPQNITVSLEDEPLGRGPTGVAVREGRWDVCSNIAADPRMAPWRAQAVARGFRSSAAFPLFVGGKVEGVMTLYSAQEAFFNPEEVEVLDSLAQDLSFAMESIDREAKRRQAEAEIRRLNEELELRVTLRTAELEFANREMEAFSYSVSHDLKSPVRAIQGFSRMLIANYADKIDDEALRMLQVIITNTKLMHHLIDDLLALSRLGRLQIKKSNVDLTAMTNKVFEKLRVQTAARDLQLSLGDLPPGWGDQSLLYQVMENLLANAIKFTKYRQNAVIEVGGRAEGKENIYYIRDNGAGFDESYVDKLFRPFQRLHKGEEYEGTGVGLAIVQRIIQRHGGRVWAEGKVGAGATFYFALQQNEA